MLIKIRRLALIAALLLTISAPVRAQFAVQPPLLPIGGANFGGWSGVKVGAVSGIVSVPGSASFAYPKGPKGWYTVGFRTENDSARDWREYYGLQLEVHTPKGRTLDITAILSTPPPAGEKEGDQTHATVRVATNGWQTTTIPWTAFNFDQSQYGLLKYVQGVGFSFKFADGKPGAVALRNIRLTRAPSILLAADVRGQSVQSGQTANYDVVVGNCTDDPQDISLKFWRDCWEAMGATVLPPNVQLAPGAAAHVTVSVTVPSDNIPAGAHETQTLVALADSGQAQIEFVTAKDIARPSLIMTPNGWDEVRQKAQTYDWAKQQSEEIIEAADKWVVPEASLPPNNYSASERHDFVFFKVDYKALRQVVEAWQLTRDPKYAQKIALFLRRLSDPKTGCPTTFAVVEAGGPQEGEDMQEIAVAYDGILDSGVLTQADKRQIDYTLRLYMQTFDGGPSVSNWAVAQITACVYCALAMGDLAAADRYIYSPGGFTDFVGKGIMSDGWWWECSTSYNMWVAFELTQWALACEP